jgi:endonuclease/exonuclease/phosphatase family metal-dependent hydrolase
MENRVEVSNTVASHPRSALSQPIPKRGKPFAWFARFAVDSARRFVFTQRGNDIEPKAARHELPWVMVLAANWNPACLSSPLPYSSSVVSRSNKNLNPGVNMPKVTIATFNCENLFARYRFKQSVDPVGADGFTVNSLAFDILNDAEKRITAQAIREVNADIIALQEVESLELLDRFHATWLAAKPYRHRMVIDSHDPRHIDVAVLSRHPFAAVRTYRHLRNAKGNANLFSRDCLEVDFTIGGKSLTLYVNHFLSMMEGREESHDRRQEQVAGVANILDARWQPLNYAGNFVVLGDFNDYVDSETALNPLVQHPQLENVVDRLPAADRWTHYYASEGDYRQLDYILISKQLANATTKKPSIMRKGLPHRATKYTGKRFDDVGENDPKASDHCPVLMELELV